jgi:hypothetical protein
VNGLRIVSWNCCRRGFAGAVDALRRLDADLALLQEVGRPLTNEPGCVWSGTNPRQGVAVVALAERFALRSYDSTDITAPVRVDGPLSFDVMNVWAQPRPTYPAHVNNTLDRFRTILARGASIVAGDFNSTRKADTARKPLHANLVARLRDEFGLVSAYHHFHACDQGCEPTATYFHLRKRAAPYHIDFCFVPVAWSTKLLRVQVLKARPWSRLSDHRPGLVEVAEDDVRLRRRAPSASSTL